MMADEKGMTAYCDRIGCDRSGVWRCRVGSIMAVLCAHHFAEWLREANPYRESIYRERTKEDWKQFHTVLADAELSGDGYCGCLSRRVWEICCDKLEEMLEQDGE